MVNHPSFEREALKVQRENKSAIKGKFAKILIGNLINKKYLMVGNKIINRCIDSGSSTASSYTHIQQQHLRTRDSGTDVTSALTVSSSHKISTILVLF
jgi:hypothetical protein